MNNTNEGSREKRRLTLDLDVELIADLDAGDDVLRGVVGDGKSGTVNSGSNTNTCVSVSAGK